MRGGRCNRCEFEKRRNAIGLVHRRILATRDSGIRRGRMVPVASWKTPRLRRRGVQRSKLTFSVGRRTAESQPLEVLRKRAIPIVRLEPNRAVWELCCSCRALVWATLPSICPLFWRASPVGLVDTGRSRARHLLLFPFPADNHGRSPRGRCEHRTLRTAPVRGVDRLPTLPTLITYGLQSRRFTDAPGCKFPFVGRLLLLGPRREGSRSPPRASLRFRRPAKASRPFSTGGRSSPSSRGSPAKQSHSKRENTNDQPSNSNAV
jgi:hypothetical protein